MHALHGQDLLVLLHQGVAGLLQDADEGRLVELLEGLAEATAGWEVVVGEERDRQATGPDGQEGRRADAVVCLRRPPASV